MVEARRILEPEPVAAGAADGDKDPTEESSDDGESADDQLPDPAN